MGNKLGSKPHPWHGINPFADKDKNILNIYIEMVPDDTVKYELDKESGYLKVDRPQKYSNIIPALYGFVPKTYCDEKVAKLSVDATGREGLEGDKDPLDICVLTEKHIRHGDVLLEAIPIGGFRMLDGGEVDDKVIAVLKNDAVYGSIKDVKDCPEGIINRLRHYFLTYKQIPKTGETPVAEITHLYGADEALKVLNASLLDYSNEFEED
ncbi:MAG: inorganic pyrophosphatase [Halobacteriovoraceae bacterium]|nr:inorganic pyrophosphatase [Halobacteriovoraceae bacterium]MBC76578.1 inorganic pyrophosphatase [Halobacteriovoraceae bacterium]|tara:strand:+ start:3006 stop:3635 length:630 start_codon:yes stop_codon:yes gene_type:complete